MLFEIPGGLRATVFLDATRNFVVMNGRKLVCFLFTHGGVCTTRVSTNFNEPLSTKQSAQMVGKKKFQGQVLSGAVVAFCVTACRAVGPRIYGSIDGPSKMAQPLKKCAATHFVAFCHLCHDQAFDGHF
jgi:hypothetical protein